MRAGSVHEQGRVFELSGRTVRRILAGTLVIGALGIAAAFDIRGKNEHERKLEACVGELVGHSVDFKWGEGHDELIIPPHYLDESVACERHDYDPREAEQAMRHIPLQEPTL